MIYCVLCTRCRILLNCSSRTTFITKYALIRHTSITDFGNTPRACKFQSNNNFCQQCMLPHWQGCIQGPNTYMRSCCWVRRYRLSTKIQQTFKPAGYTHLNTAVLELTAVVRNPGLLSSQKAGLLKFISPLSQHHRQHKKTQDVSLLYREQNAILHDLQSPEIHRKEDEYLKVPNTILTSNHRFTVASHQKHSINDGQCGQFSGAKGNPHPPPTISTSQPQAWWGPFASRISHAVSRHLLLIMLLGPKTNLACYSNTNAPNEQIFWGSLTAKPLHKSQSSDWQFCVR